jgi:N-acetylglucosamine kinase-like BadF-type ATPase
LIQGWSNQHQLTRNLTVVNDAQLVVAAGTPNGYGVGLICGTGSIAIGRGVDGRMSRAGGWGYLLGDEGSGYDIALQVLRAACQAADGRGADGTTLLAELIQMWELSGPFDLIPYVYNQPDPRAILADIPPLVSRLALEGNSVCITILQAAGRDLAKAVIAAAKPIGLHSSIPLALAGSVILRTPLLHTALCNTLAEYGHPADPVTPVEDPAIGALRLAREAYIVQA